MLAGQAAEQAEQRECSQPGKPRLLALGVPGPLALDADGGAAERADDERNDGLDGHCTRLAHAEPQAARSLSAVGRSYSRHRHGSLRVQHPRQHDRVAMR